MKIWREGTHGQLTGCAGYFGTNYNAVTPTAQTVGNSFMRVREIVRFDEHENPYGYVLGVVLPEPILPIIALPESSTVATTSGVFPALASSSGDKGGWMYFNLDGGIVAGPPHPEQAWVVVSMAASPLFSVDFDAAWLGNGCSPSVDVTPFMTRGGTGKIGPLP